jgi:hypothetical protein
MDFGAVAGNRASAKVTNREPLGRSLMSRPRVEL